MARAMTEDELLLAITEAATLTGWRWHHVRRSDVALQMGSAGFPDLVMARDGAILFLELKAEAGVVTTAQREWIAALDGGNTRVTAAVIRPGDLDRVLALMGANTRGRHP